MANSRKTHEAKKLAETRSAKKYLKNWCARRDSNP
jgi:hypothetical protein